MTSSADRKKVLVIGATGNQGGGLITHLLTTKEWYPVALTRNPDSPSARSLANRGVEIIKGDKTSEDTTNIIIKLSQDLNKIPICCNDSPGFVSNRILMPMINEAALCFEEGVASAEAIDSIMKLGMGHPMGPLRLADLIGIDVCVMILQVLYDGFKDKKYKPSNILINLMDNNKLGKKTGEGFYKYEL